MGVILLLPAFVRIVRSKLQRIDLLVARQSNYYSLIDKWLGPASSVDHAVASSFQAVG